MYNFEYVTRNEALPVKKELIKIINQVQDLVREHFTFNFYFIGSTDRNMITQDIRSNIGFDFDVNIEVNDDEENYQPGEIRKIIRLALDQVARKYGYVYTEDSTRVLTTKFVDKKNSRIKHSCDFAIVNNCNDGRQQYIRFNKSTNSYSWEYQPKGFIGLETKADWLKKNGYWQDVRDYYIEKKNNNTNPDKKSRSLYAETINEIYQRYN